MLRWRQLWQTIQYFKNSGLQRFYNFIQRKSFYSIKYHSKSLFSLIFSYPKKENGFCWCWVTTSLIPINSITWRSKTSFKIICKSMKFWHKRCLRCYTFYINVVEVRSYVGKKLHLKLLKLVFRIKISNLIRIMLCAFCISNCLHKNQIEQYKVYDQPKSIHLLHNNLS